MANKFGELCTAQNDAGDPLNPRKDDQGNNVSYPFDRDFNIDVDLDVSGLDTMPTELEPLFGAGPRGRPLLDPLFDTQAIVETTLIDVDCTVTDAPLLLEPPIPASVQFLGLVTAFRLATAFKTTWDEVEAISGACTIID